ncbi:hypothetical protein SBADM41S_06294 [Streptomyces badius]
MRYGAGAGHGGRGLGEHREHRLHPRELVEMRGAPGAAREMGLEVARLGVVEDAEDVRGGRVVLGPFGVRAAAGTGAEASGRAGGTRRAGRAGDAGEVGGP